MSVYSAVLVASQGVVKVLVLEAGWHQTCYESVHMLLSLHVAVCCGGLHGAHVGCGQCVHWKLSNWRASAGVRCCIGQLRDARIVSCGLP
jgi:hypothetical protein